MPKYKTHLVGGIITFLLTMIIANYFNYFKRLSWEQIFTYFTLCILGSLFPDIDTKSKIQKWIYYPLFFVIIVAIFTKNWILLSFVSVIAFIPIIANHRGITHKLWFVVLVPLAPLSIFHFNKTFLTYAFSCYLFFVIGAISHLLLDFGPKRLFR